MANITRVEQLVRIRVRNIERTRRREEECEEARAAYLRQVVRRESIVARYDRAVVLVIESRELTRRILDRLYPTGSNL